jgi:hypothetical protein
VVVDDASGDCESKLGLTPNIAHPFPCSFSSLLYRTGEEIGESPLLSLVDGTKRHTAERLTWNL